MAHDLARPDEIPSAIRSSLDRYANIFRRAEFLEQVLEEDALPRIAEDLNGLCNRDGVVGYHYTRGFSESIAAKGLIAQTGDERRRKFLLEFGDRFSDSQL